MRGRKRKRYFRDCRAVPRPTRSTPRDAHARADPARAHELAKDTAPSEPVPSGRAPRLHPTGTRPIRAWPLGRLPSVSTPRPNANVLFQSTARRWARAREPTRGADPREGGFAFARIFPRSQLAAAMESRRTRDRGEAPARERSNVRFFPRFFSARFKRPVGGPDGVLTESSPPRARTPCHVIPRLALARFQTRIVVASARAGWPRARDTRLPRRAPPRILRARAKRTRRARPRKPPPERLLTRSQNPPTRRNRRNRFRLHLRPFPRWRSARAAAAGAA